MGKEGLICLFWICALGALAGFSFGIGNIISVGAGCITAGVCSVLIIPCGIEFNSRIVKRENG
jgi:hypothetical protein